MMEFLQLSHLFRWLNLLVKISEEVIKNNTHSHESKMAALDKKKDYSHILL